MQAKPKCIITGCDLVALDAQQFTHGDLWELEDVYIFNAVLRNGEAYWQDTLDAPVYGDKAIIISKFTNSYFERRGVFVIAKTIAMLTHLAKEYINASR